MFRRRLWLVIWIVFLTAIGLAPTSAFRAQNGITVTTNGQLNLRGGPGTNYPSLAHIPNQTVLPAVGRNDRTTWIEVDFNGTLGWLSASLLTPTGDLAALPVRGAPAPAAFPAPTIPLYDDFAGPSVSPDRWYFQGSDYVQSIDNHTLYFNISWYVMMFVRTNRSIREISVSFTMEQPNTGNDGLDLVIIGAHTYGMALNHCKVVGINEIVPDNQWINYKGVNLADTKCPSTHLLGISVDASRARFYLDGKQVDSRPWTGPIQQAWVGGWAYPTFQANDKVAPNFNDPNFKPTIGRANRVWIDYMP